MDVRREPPEGIVCMSEDPAVRVLSDEEFERDLYRQGIRVDVRPRHRLSKRRRRRALEFIALLTKGH